MQRAHENRFEWLTPGDPGVWPSEDAHTRAPSAAEMARCRLVQLVALALLLHVRPAASVDVNAEIDYEPLRSKIRALLESPPQAPCRYPEGAIMVTYANAHMFRLTVLQRRALEINRMRECVERRLVTVCLDARCLELCEEDGIPNCVDLKIATTPSNFRTADYYWITYVKHEILEAAAQVATEAFFFDTDTLIFDDPWSVNLTAPAGPYDLRYQHESSPDEVCAGGVNGGQLYVRSSNATAAYFAAMRAFKPQILDGTKGLDQDYIFHAADAANLTRCGLDSAYFIGHCGGSRIPTSDSKKIVVYHVNCAGGDTKWGLLSHFYKVRAAEKELNIDVAVSQADG